MNDLPPPTYRAFCAAIPESVNIFAVGYSHKPRLMARRASSSFDVEEEEAPFVAELPFMAL